MPSQVEAKDSRRLGRKLYCFRVRLIGSLIVSLYRTASRHTQQLLTGKTASEDTLHASHRRPSLQLKSSNMCHFQLYLSNLITYKILLKSNIVILTAYHRCS